MRNRLVINQQLNDTANGLCQFLDWDSEFFGCRIARLTINRLDSVALCEIMAWCRTNSIDCLYFLSDLGDATTIRLVEENHFHFVDLRVTLDAQIKVPVHFDYNHPQVSVRTHRPSDISLLRSMARVSYYDSRFYYDSHFPTSRCGDLYETWIEKSCSGYADEVLVAEWSGRPAGYITCHIRDQHQLTGQIGLAAVSPDAKGNGIGQQLVRESLRWFGEHNIQQVTVVTQGRNSQAQRIYQRCGFLTRSMQAWYHRWYLD